MVTDLEEVVVVMVQVEEDTGKEVEDMVKEAEGLVKGAEDTAVGAEDMARTLATIKPFRSPLVWEVFPIP